MLTPGQDKRCRRRQEARRKETSNLGKGDKERVVLGGGEEGRFENVIFLLDAE